MHGFLGSRSGNVAMMWALMGTVLIGLVGLSIDFTRAQAIQSAMQNAADGAVLVAERSANRPLSERQAAARAFFNAEVGDIAERTNFTVRELTAGGHEVQAVYPMQMGLARLVQDRPWNIRVNASAEANASPPIEVALVLDNTGSMANDMNALRSAASDLAADLLSLDGDTVNVALVPFVAQVNIGNQQSHLAWMDQAGTAPMNGELLEDRMIGFRDTNNGAPNGNCNFPTTPAGYAGPYRLTFAQRGNRCHFFTPSDGINYFTLFDLISNEDWKGCVEARPEPYDISDAAPNPANPSTMFVPFFWLDTGGTAGQASSSSSGQPNYRSSNSYLADTPGDLPTTMTTSNGAAPNAQDQREARFFNVFKYRGTAATIDSVAPDTMGPNRGCPTPIVPLTSNGGTIQTNIAAMRHWNGGGTNQAEGLAWGWRVLTPTAPFTEGEEFNSAHDNVRKVIVLMSDGENTNVGTDPVVGADYSAYNHMGFWRDIATGDPLTELLFGLLHGVLPPQFRRNISSSNQYVTYVNGRQRALCTAIKNDHIEIYTVIFRETDQATVNLMRDCASGTDHFFRADSASELSQAFDAIGTGIGQLRITH